ncbi:hypothetical protein D9M71_604630 [compost metagenome]
MSKQNHAAILRTIKAQLSIPHLVGVRHVIPDGDWHCAVGQILTRMSVEEQFGVLDLAMSLKHCQPGATTPDLIDAALIEAAR